MIKLLQKIAKNTQPLTIRNLLIPFALIGVTGATKIEWRPILKGWAGYLLKEGKLKVFVSWLNSLLSQFAKLSSAISELLETLWVCERPLAEPQR